MESPDYLNPGCLDHACLECPGGSTCPDSGMAAPNECGIGKYSPPGQSYVVCPDCLPGYYCDNSTTSQDDMITNKPCPPGTNCGESEGPQGEIPELVQNSCPLGYYCPGTEADADDPNAQITDPQPCPPGTYGAEMGLTSESEVAGDFNVRFCLPCPEGYYCPDQGDNNNAADPTNPGIPNWAVNVDEDNEDYKDYYDTKVYPCRQFLECPPGQYCEAGRIAPEPCDPGFYQPFVKQVDIESCAKCISGYFCDEEALPEPKDCPAYHYCPPYDEIANNGNCNGCDTSDSINSDGNEFRCPPGQYADSENLRTKAESPVCPAGQNCPYFAEVNPPPCLARYCCPVALQLVIKTALQMVLTMLVRLCHHLSYRNILHCRFFYSKNVCRRNFHRKPWF